MIVMAIVAIVSVAAVTYTPEYVARRQLEGAAFQLVQDLRDVQASAMFTRNTFAVTFDVPNNQYSFQKDPGGPVVVRRFNSAIGFASVVAGSGFTDDTIYLSSVHRSTAASPAVVVLYFGPRGNPLLMGPGSPSMPTEPLDSGAYVALATAGGTRIDVTISQVIGQIGMHWH